MTVFLAAVELLGPRRHANILWIDGFVDDRRFLGRRRAGIAAVVFIGGVFGGGAIVVAIYLCWETVTVPAQPRKEFLLTSLHSYY
jgi:hypothetical protein